MRDEHEEDDSIAGAGGGGLAGRRIEAPQGWLRHRNHHYHANAWGGRRLLSIASGASPALPNSTTRATLVDTPMFEASTMFLLSLNFGANNGFAVTPAPVGFSPLAAARVNVTLRHGMDPRQGTIDDVYSLSPSAFLQPGETGVTNPVWLPVSLIETRKLTVLVEITTAGASPNSVWVDCAATPVTALDSEQILAARGDNTNVFGWPSMVSTRTAYVASPAHVTLLDASAARRQFFVTNEATTRLALGFGQVPDLTPGSERWDVILDAKGGPNPFYRSGVDQHWGVVYGIWETGGAGFAMATETDIFG